MPGFRICWDLDDFVNKHQAQETVHQRVALQQFDLHILCRQPVKFTQRNSQ